MKTNYVGTRNIYMVSASIKTSKAGNPQSATTASAFSKTAGGVVGAQNVEGTSSTRRYSDFTLLLSSNHSRKEHWYLY